ncbi:MAG TPA: hypothetical protein PLC66_04525 [Thauera sp.]|nr:hypothetical protein [Thauera sp.]HRP23221.1 hypothetical protein [Thauera sp.]
MRAKPAGHFGGKFRIIDFALSDCTDSGLRRIGVITQYKSHSPLHDSRRPGDQRGCSTRRAPLSPHRERRGAGDPRPAGQALIRPMPPREPSLTAALPSAPAMQPAC